jgi:hypothetical protein
MREVTFDLTNGKPAPIPEDQQVLVGSFTLVGQEYTMYVGG